ncbi:MAG: aldolase/citrate lyase family protein [Chloroflexota bacterium]|nr:aldolase/citrate lyase family protein [Chloroflexota bacterium]
MNPMRDRLKAGKTVVGTAGSVFADNMVMLADSGLDFILFDTQHSPIEPKEYKASFDAIKGKPVTPIMRVSANRAELICYALDLGARGVIVPMVNTKEEATAMVRACQYSPLGDRSNAGVRGEWGDFGDSNYREYLDTVNEELLIIPMIETQQAIDNIDEILSVPGIDVLLVGPSDLSIELNVPLDYPSDAYQAGLDKIAEACKRHNVVPGMYFIPPTMDPNFYVEKGFKFFTMPWAGWALQGIGNGLGAINRD